MGHSIKSSIHFSTVSASIRALCMSLRSAVCAHSSSVIRSYLVALSMEKIFRRVLRVRARVLR